MAGRARGRTNIQKSSIHGARATDGPNALHVLVLVVVVVEQLLGFVQPLEVGVQLRNIVRQVSRSCDAASKVAIDVVGVALVADDVGASMRACVRACLRVCRRCGCACVGV